MRLPRRNEKEYQEGKKEQGREKEIAT